MQNLSKKIIHLCIIFIIIIAIIFTAIMFILKYDEKGETNMPFNLSKINIISTIGGEDVADEANKWNIKIDLNNDLNLYIEKNEKYRKQETIKCVKINNIKVLEEPKIGEIKIFKPINDELLLYKNNVDEEIKHNELIKKINVKEEDITSKIAFDLIICLDSGKSYKAEVDIKIPNEGIVENGKQGLEINDLNDVVFKRIKNNM